MYNASYDPNHSVAMCPDAPYFIISFCHWRYQWKSRSFHSLDQNKQTYGLTDISYKTIQDILGHIANIHVFRSKTLGDSWNDRCNTTVESFP